MGLDETTAACTGVVRGEDGPRPCELMAQDHSGECFWQCGGEVCSTRRAAGRKAGGARSATLKRLAHQRSKLTTPEALERWRLDLLAKMQTGEVEISAGTSALWAVREVTGSSNGVHAETARERARGELVSMLRALNLDYQRPERIGGWGGRIQANSEHNPVPWGAN